MSANFSTKGKYTFRMMRYKVKSVIKKCGVFYVIGLVIAFTLKLYYSRADIDALDWILAPTTRWVQLLCGIKFEKELGVGYINHNYKFVIAPVCAGINFMIIAFTTLLFSFIHRMSTVKGRVIWLLLSLVFIYPYTILVNSLRIIPSIYLLQMDFYGGWLTPERVHTMEGTLVYFAALLFLYSIADKVATRLSLRFSQESVIEAKSCEGGKSCAKGCLGIEEQSAAEGHLVGERHSDKDEHAAAEGQADGVEHSSARKQSVKPVYYAVIKRLLPVFFYFSVTLGIPFLNGAYRNNSENFMEYSVLVFGVCFFVIALICLCLIPKKYLVKKRNNISHHEDKLEKVTV